MGTVFKWLYSKVLCGIICHNHKYKKVAIYFERKEDKK